MIEQFLNIVFKFMGIPLLSAGGVFMLFQQSKGIFSKEALSIGVLTYALWWVWLVVVLTFTVCMAMLSFKNYAELIN